jgi:hypothetical protein
MSQNIITQPALNKTLVDKFRLVFTLPPALLKINKRLALTNREVDQDTVQFSIHGTVVPDIIVPATEIRYAGNTLFNSSHSKDSYPPNEVKFAIDNEFKNYWVIWNWINLLHHEREGLFNVRGLADDDSYLEYTTDISITGLDEMNNSIITWVYTKAFPTILGKINYSYQEDGQIECSFSFVYSQIHVRREGVQ